MKPSKKQSINNNLKQKNTQNVNQQKLKSNKFKKYYWLGLIILLTFIVYYNSLKYGFLNWDDPTLVTDNPYIKYFT